MDMVVGLPRIWPAPSICLCCILVSGSLWRIFQTSQWCCHSIFSLSGSSLFDSGGTLQDGRGKIVASCDVFISFFNFLFLMVIMRFSNKPVFCLFASFVMRTIYTGWKNNWKKKKLCTFHNLRTFEIKICKFIFIIKLVINKIRCDMQLYFLVVI